VQIPSTIIEIDSYGLAHWGPIKADIAIGSSNSFSNLSLEKTQGGVPIISSNYGNDKDIFNIYFYTKNYKDNSIINGILIGEFFDDKNLSSNYNITVHYIDS